MSRWSDWRARAAALKREVVALSLACRDPRTPWYAKLAAACVVAYALSPIDLIPDPVPVLGYLDDLILLPLGILFVRELIPRQVLEDCRGRAKGSAAEWSVGRWGAAAVLGMWAATAAGLLVWGWNVLVQEG